MKKRNLAITLFSCALLSTSYVSTEVVKMAQGLEQASRSVASVEDTAEQPFYKAWAEQASKLYEEATTLAKDVYSGDKSILVTANISLTNILDTSVVDSKIVEKFKKLQVTYNTLESEKQKLDLEINLKEEKVKELTKDLETTNLQVGNIMDNMDNEIDQLRVDAETLLEQRESMALALEQQTLELKELQLVRTQFTETKATIEKLGQRIGELESKNLKLTAKNKNLESENTRLSCLLKGQSTLDKQIAELTKTNREAMDKITKLEEKSEEKSEEKVSKKKNKIAKNSNDAVLERMTSLWTMLVERQEQQQMMNSIQEMFQRQNRTALSQMSGLSGNYSNYLERDFEMVYEMENMRRYENYRLESGAFFGPISANPRTPSAYEIDNSFANRYINSSPLLYSPLESFSVDQFNSNRAFDFRLNPSAGQASPRISFTPAPQMEPSFIRIN